MFCSGQELNIRRVTSQVRKAFDTFNMMPNITTDFSSIQKLSLFSRGPTSCYTISSRLHIIALIFPCFSYGFPSAAIMHQHATASHIIRVEPRNVEVVDVDRRFQKLVLDLFNDYIFAVDQNQNISCAKMHRVCPALDRRVEGMPRR